MKLKAASVTCAVALSHVKLIHSVEMTACLAVYMHDLMQLCKWSILALQQLAHVAVADAVEVNILCLSYVLWLASEQCNEKNACNTLKCTWCFGQHMLDHQGSHLTNSMHALCLMLRHRLYLWPEKLEERSDPEIWFCLMSVCPSCLRLPVHKQVTPFVK